MSRVRAIAWLTFREGIRMRIVVIFLVVLGVLIVLLPDELRGDETIAGRLQNFLSYSLGAMGFLLSLATVFFSCATLTTELKEKSLHLVVTKPVSRFEILLGKWLGVNLLNVLIVALCGVAIYAFASEIKSRPQQFARDRYKVRDVVWTARIATTPVVPEKKITEAAKRYVEAGLQSGEIAVSQRGKAYAERVETLLKQWRVVPNGNVRAYRFENLLPPEAADTVFQVRYKVNGIPLPPEEIVHIGWAFLDPEDNSPLHEPTWMEERSGQVHQFLATAAPVIRDGVAELLVINPFNPVSSSAYNFDGQDSLQLLYKAGSFEVNFIKVLLVVLLRLSLLSALGIFFGVFVSFPVACLCVCAFLVICMGMPFWLESVGAGMEHGAGGEADPYGMFGPAVRVLLVPLMRFAFPDFTRYSGVQHLIEGEYISLALVGRCCLHTLVYGTALLLIPGWLLFRRKEIAEVMV